MDIRSRPRVGVMGPSICTPEVRDLARQIGRAIAHHGGILICGGGAGVMEAAAQGAKEEGGITVGILPGSHPSDANHYIDLPIVTDIGNARNVINVLTSQAIIALSGSFGTLSEIALALKCGIPVVTLRSWSLTSPAGKAPDEIVVAKTPDEAVSTAFRLIRERSISH